MIPWLDIQDQIGRYVQRRAERNAELAAIKDRFSRLLKNEASERWEEWRELAARGDAPHLVPDFDEPPGAARKVPPLPSPPAVAAADGSQVFPSRHEIAPIAMIHVSMVGVDYMHYENPPLLESRARVLMDDDFEPGGGEFSPSFEDLVSDRRAVEEMDALAEAARSVSTDGEVPCAALTDGSLVLWRLASREFHEYENRVTADYLKGLDRLRGAEIPAAGYISASGSREVVQLLQLIQTALGWESGEGEPDATAPGPVVNDRMLFQDLLKPGQRSAVFHSRSKILKHYGGNAVSYFFLHVGAEAAKVEIPRWVADRPEWLDRVAAVCLQQADLGRGYPVLLSEAHEQAVIRSADRQAFFALLEEAMLREGFHPQRSAKQIRKQASIL